MSMRFDWITTTRELDELRDTWDTLAGDRLGVFRTWEWLATWWRVLGYEPGCTELRVLVAREHGEAKAILPMYVADSRVARAVRRRRLRLMGDGVVGSDYLGLVASEADARRLAAPMIAEVREQLGGELHGVAFDDLLEGDVLVEAARAGLSGGRLRFRSVPRFVCPYAALGGTTWSDYLAARPNGFGSQLGRRRRKLEAERGFRLFVATRPDEVTAALDSLFLLHHARWQPEGGSNAIPGVRVEQFHRQTAQLLAERGWARLALLSMRGQPVAAGYGFSCGSRFAYYQAGIDPSWRNRSAGTVVLGELLARAFDERLEEFDFLRGEETYKGIWADRTRHTQAFRVDRNGALDRVANRLELLSATGRRAARQRLPSQAVAALRWLQD